MRIFTILTDGTIVGASATCRYPCSWDPNGKRIHKFPGLSGQRLTAVVYSREAQLLAQAFEYTIVLEKTTRGLDSEGDSYWIEGHVGHIECLAFSPQGTILVSGSADGAIGIWDVSGQTELIRFHHGHQAAIVGVVFLPQPNPINASLVTASADGKICFRDNDGRLIFTSKVDEQITAIAVSPEGELAVAITGNFKVRPILVYSLGVQQLQLKTTLDEIQGDISCLALSPDGNLLASGSEDATVRLWDVESERPVAVCEDLFAPIAALRFVNNGNVLMGVCHCGWVCKWPASGGDAEMFELRQ